ncbi:MAG: hypothetical protein HY698_19010 [Deltaproteobacteria bacterium]|nr:hypothetical protein [Deltaproteobacteria bacterium]
MRSRAVALAVAVGASSCGLISSDIDDVKFSLPENKFEVSVSDFRLAGFGSKVPEVPCEQVDCATEGTRFCSDTSRCSASCGGDLCQVSARISVFEKVDLRPTLSKLDGKVKVSIDSVRFDVTDNSLSIDTPPLDVFIAPFTVTDAGNEGAKRVGTIAPVPAKTVLASKLEFTEGGKATMEEFMANYETEFNVFLVGQVTLKGGQDVPTGGIVGTIKAVAVASAF